MACCPKSKHNQWLQRPDPEEWSILQILCHLWQAENQCAPATAAQDLCKRMTHSSPPCPRPGRIFRPAMTTAYEVMDLVLARAADGRWPCYPRFSPPTWERPARHSIFGLTNLLEMAHFTAQHDRLHISPNSVRHWANAPIGTATTGSSRQLLGPASSLAAVQSDCQTFGNTFGVGFASI